MCSVGLQRLEQHLWRYVEQLLHSYRDGLRALHSGDPPPPNWIQAFFISDRDIEAFVGIHNLAPRYWFIELR